MSFKNMKRDDHGHVIGNDEVDGQKCQHQSGKSSKSQDNSERENLRKEVEYKLKNEGNTSDVRLMAERRGFKIENGKVVEDLKSQAMADRATGGSGEAFDEDYEEEFNDIGNSIEKGLTDEGKKLMSDANKAGFGDNYDPMTGNIGLSDKDLIDKKDAINQWLNEHPDYKLVKDKTGEQAAWLTTDIYDDDEFIEDEPQKEYGVGTKFAIKNPFIKTTDNYEITNIGKDYVGITGPGDVFQKLSKEDFEEQFFNKRLKEENPYAEQRKQMDEAADDFNDRINKYNRMVGLESQMHSKIDNARKNGQSPQQVLDSVAYDMDLQPGTEEYDRLKTLVMYDTRMNKDTGQYEYNKYNSGSNKQVSGDERKKLQDLSDAFNKAGLENKLKDTWEDYGAKMGMTNLIHNNTQVLNPRDWIDYMNGNASADEIIQRVKNSPYKSVYKWKEPQNDRQTIIDYYKQKGKDINTELLDKELKSAVHKDFKEGEQVFDTSYGGKGTPAKIIRKLSMKENLDRAGLNNPLAGDYYEIETEFLGTPSRRIVWAGRLDKGE